MVERREFPHTKKCYLKKLAIGSPAGGEPNLMSQLKIKVFE